MTTKRHFNQGQLDVLKTLYKFRFGTRDLIASGLNKKNGNAVYSRLSILEQQGILGKRYGPSYKLQGRAAEYYLTPSGLRTLREQTELESLSDNVIKGSYKDKNISDQFISRCLSVFAVSNSLIKAYPNLQFFTKRELSGYDYFPDQLPDGFISYKADGETKRYFLELFTDDVQPFVIDRRLRQFITYYENDEWTATETSFPSILCLCETEAVEKRVRKQVNRTLNRLETDLSFYLTTLSAVLYLSKGGGTIWSGIGNPDKRIALENL